jgi:hypothetical protein
MMRSISSKIELVSQDMTNPNLDSVAGGDPESL